ncbi:MAG TPA: MFS transporter [Rhodospirillaceae bacterium]|nr:MFS transporter [Rhodospirillaceae bacterium]
MQPTPTERRNVLVLASSQSLFTITTITVMTLASVIGLELSPDPDLATLPIALMMLATVFTTLPASLLMKRIGRRNGFMLGTLSGLIGSALMLLGTAQTSFFYFCAGMFMIGLYQSFAMYYRFAAADVARAEFRSRAVSYVMAGGVISAIVGPLNARFALDWLPAIPMGGPFLVTTILAVAATILLLTLRIPAHPPGEPIAGNNTSRPLAVIARDVRFLPAVVGSSVCFSLMALYMTVTPLGMQEQGFGMASIIPVVQSQVLAMFIPAFFTGTLIARFGLRPVLWCGVGLLSIAMVIGALSHTVPLYMASRITLGIGWNFLFVGSAVLLSHTHQPAERGKVQGVNDLTLFSLVTVGSISAAALLQRLGWNGLHLASLIPLGVVALLLLRMQWRRKAR